MISLIPGLSRIYTLYKPKRKVSSLKSPLIQISMNLRRSDIELSFESTARLTLSKNLSAVLTFISFALTSITEKTSYIFPTKICLHEILFHSLSIVLFSI